MYKISVIIPIFNAENTIERAIDSILKQKWNGEILKDIEIILVDDCSNDNSKEIILSYSERFTNIKIYSTEINTGFPAEPRNIGIKNANGKYIMFMDNDDEYCEDICKTLYDVITKEKADVVACNFYHKLPNSKLITENAEFDVENIIYEEDYVILDDYNSLILNDILPWNKIYDKSLLLENNLFFPCSFPFILLDDRFFSMELYSKIDKMIFLKNYHGITKFTQYTSLSQVSDKNILLNGIKAAIELHKKADSYIDFNKNKKYKFNFTRDIINNYLFRIIFLENNDDITICLKEMNCFENKIGFDNSLNDSLLKFINYFILKNRVFHAFLIIKILKTGYKFDLIKKIWRRLKLS